MIKADFLKYERLKLLILNFKIKMNFTINLKE